jgi:hypothetical protein
MSARSGALLRCAWLLTGDAGKAEDLLQGVALEGLGTGEQTLARRLWPRLGAGDVVVGDRNLLSYEDLAAVVVRTGAHAQMRRALDRQAEVLLGRGPHSLAC